MNVLHNMSAPPRTQVTLQGRPISSQVVVYSLTYALIINAVVEVPPPLGQGFLLNILDQASSMEYAVRRKWAHPRDMFAQIGSPVSPVIPWDFLIGWNPSANHFGLTGNPFDADSPSVQSDGPTPELCRDPRHCAGVLSRCARTLYLSRREPDLTWETLLAAPVAFDEPMAFPS